MHQDFIVLTVLRRNVQCIQRVQSSFRRIVTAVASRWKQLSNLACLKFEDQTSRYGDDRVTTRPPDWRAICMYFTILTSSRKVRS